MARGEVRGGAVALGVVGVGFGRGRGAAADQALQIVVGETAGLRRLRDRGDAADRVIAVDEVGERRDAGRVGELGKAPRIVESEARDAGPAGSELTIMRQRKSDPVDIVLKYPNHSIRSNISISMHAFILFRNEMFSFEKKMSGKYVCA